jgi:hypothetical protein
MEEGTNEFIERIQGVEMSLFIENVFQVESKESHASGLTGVDNVVKKVIERKDFIEEVNKENENVQNQFMTDVYGIASAPGRERSQVNPSSSSREPL